MKKVNFKSTIIAAAVAIIALGSCEKPAEENALKGNRLSSKKTGESALSLTPVASPYRVNYQTS